MLRTLLIFSTLLFYFSLFAQPSSIEPNITTTDENSTGKIVFIRNMPGGPLNCNTFINDNLASKLNNRRYSVHEVAPGTYNYSAQLYGKRRNNKRLAFPIQVEAGETKYVLLCFKMASLGCELIAVEISPEAAQALMKDLKEDKK